MFRRGALLTLLVLAALPAWAAPASAEVVWLCRPGLAENPCEIPQDTTVEEEGQPARVVTPPDGPREIDCFYVYPTVSNQLTPNATKDRDPELESIAKFQAARFSTQCRIFAPIYRQSTLASIATGYASASGADRQLAYGDVLEAWRDYLAKDNGGRGVVLIGHSQGTAMLRQLLRREIETQPGQLRRVVSALLLGGNVTVATGRNIDGDFRRTPLCERRAQVGCVVAFSTFYEDPPSNPRFGRTNPPPAENPSTLPGGPGYEVACTDPRPLAGTSEPFRLLTPSEPFATGPIQAGIVITAGGPPPSAATTWVSPPDRGEGGCRWLENAHVLRIEPLPGSRRLRWYPEPSWGTHLVDVNLALDPLVSLVAQQARRWTRPDIRLVRRCAGRRLRMRLTGTDLEFAGRVRFRRERRHVRATVELRQGAPERLVLRRTRPRC